MISVKRFCEGAKLSVFFFPPSLCGTGQWQLPLLELVGTTCLQKGKTSRQRRRKMGKKLDSELKFTKKKKKTVRDPKHITLFI